MKTLSSLLLFQLGPSRIKRIHLFLSCFQLRVSRHQARTVADNLGIFQLVAFGLQYQLGIGDALLNGVIFPRFQV